MLSKMKWGAPFFNENQNKEDFTMKIFEKKNNLQEQEKRMQSRLIAYQKAAEKIERKQPSRHMIRRG